MHSIIILKVNKGIQTYFIVHLSGYATIIQTRFYGKTRMIYLYNVGYMYSEKYNKLKNKILSE